MILDKEIEIKVDSRHSDHYESKGYKVPKYINSKNELRVKRGTKIIVKAKDLPPGSSVSVEVECDYCGKHFKCKYFAYHKSVIQGEIKKVACKGKCSQQKLEESNFRKYGVRTPYEREEINTKVKNTMKERYGVEYAAQNKEINERSAKKKIMSFEKVSKRFIDKGLIPLFYPKKYTGVFNELPFVCKKHGNKIQYITLELLDKSPYGCRYCGKESKMSENHHAWKGGTSALQQYLRSYLKNWKKDSLKANGYECVITGNKMSDIHHLYSFNLIRDEALNNLNIPIKTQISEYTNEELESIVSECRNLHKQYGLGVPLSEEVHNLFHSIYGKGNNTPEQFEEFKIRYESGEFNDVLNKQ